MDLDQMVEILSAISCPPYTFEIVDCSTYLYLQAWYEDADVDTGEKSHQKTRKWLLSRHMVRSELVQTAMKCALTSAEHRIREHFRYRGEQVYGPHFDVDALHTLCLDKQIERRAARQEDLPDARA